jgi:hypothetical protein
MKLTVKRYNVSFYGIVNIRTGEFVKAYDKYTGQDEILLFATASAAVEASHAEDMMVEVADLSYDEAVKTNTEVARRTIVKLMDEMFRADIRLESLVWIELCQTWLLGGSDPSLYCESLIG